MEIKGIKYIAPVFDVSGYAEASRNYILALHKLGIPLTIQPVSFESGEAELGSTKKLLKSLVNKPIDYNIVLIHLTVEHYQKFIEPGKINVGYSIWETDRIHDKWVNWINEYMDLIFTASEWGVDVYKKSGVKKPIVKIPHCIDIDKYQAVKPYKVAGVPDDAYKFYAMFQFIERKNPLALIKAYWYAFQNDENVALILKTYRQNFSEEEQKVVRHTLKKLKEVTPMNKYPPIYLVLNKLSNDEVLGLHKSGDCLVHLDRGEGWGLVPFTAGVLGKPIIITGWGGSTEYADITNSYLIDYVLEPVYGMGISPFYDSTQLWAYPSILHASQLMRHVYANQDEALLKGSKLHEFIDQYFNYDVVGELMVTELNQFLKSYK